MSTNPTTGTLTNAYKDALNGARGARRAAAIADGTYWQNKASRLPNKRAKQSKDACRKGGF